MRLGFGWLTGLEFLSVDRDSLFSVCGALADELRPSSWRRLVNNSTAQSPDVRDKCEYAGDPMVVAGSRDLWVLSVLGGRIRDFRSVDRGLGVSVSWSATEMK